MRLSQREQIMLQKAAHDNPGSLADWLLGWVETQQKVGVNGTFDIAEIPIPVDLDRIVPSSPSAIRLSDEEWRRQMDQAATPNIEVTISRAESREKWRKLLEAVDYTNLPKHERKAINKFKQARIKVVEETDRLPDTEVCWMGDHDMDGWEDDDFYLWVVAGEWSSGKSIRKWGCKGCAMAIAQTHPGAVVVAHEVD